MLQTHRTMIALVLGLSACVLAGARRCPRQNPTLRQIVRWSVRRAGAPIISSSSKARPPPASALGHSTIGITLDLYSHVMPGMQADAAAQVDGALRTAISGGAGTK